MTTGWKITEVSIQRNRKAQQDLSARRKNQAHLQVVYDEAVKKGTLEKKILLVTQGAEFSEQEYGKSVGRATGIFCRKTVY